jgi:hypothetical protein
MLTLEDVNRREWPSGSSRATTTTSPSRPGSPTLAYQFGGPTTVFMPERNTPDAGRGARKVSCRRAPAPPR